MALHRLAYPGAVGPRGSALRPRPRGTDPPRYQASRRSEGWDDRRPSEIPCGSVESEQRMFRSIRFAGRRGRVGALVVSTALVATGIVVLSAGPALAAATGGV